MYILAIDTSCDETSVAVCHQDWILANKVASQIELHKQWGGVVPSIAKRMHQATIDTVLRTALSQSRVPLERIDVFAVTRGPGLAIALEVGISKALELARHYSQPIIAINHMEGHIYSTLAKNSRGVGKGRVSFPALCLLISGGHTELVLMRDHGVYEILGRTLDDAVGEAFDKVARMLELGYPGGPVIEYFARRGDPTRFQFPIPMSKSSDLAFSYSGIKTALLYFVQRDVYPQKDVLSSEAYAQLLCDVCASFQRAVFQSLVLKLRRALSLPGLAACRCLIVGGGVSANKELRRLLRAEFGSSYSLLFPVSSKLYGDNAGMIGVAAYYHALRGHFADFAELDRLPHWSLGS